MQRNATTLFAMLALGMSGAAYAQANAPTEAQRIGYNELRSGKNLAAIQEIKSNAALSADDPAGNINLAIAYAREGREEEARECFEMALASSERVSLQTASGEWIDSRELARAGLRKLALGTFSQERLAANR